MAALVEYQALHTPRFWLLGIGTALIAVHLNLVWQAEDPNLTAISLLVAGAVASSLQDKYRSLKLESGIFPTLLGAVLVLGIMVKALSVTGGAYFPRLSPLVSATGLALLASGFSGLKQYWRELAMLSLIGIPEILISLLSDPSPLTAQFAALTLWYTGFEVVKEGVNLYLPGGAIEVYPGCSGVESMGQLLSFAGLFLLTFPTRWSQKILLPVIAIAIGFVFNGIRVALLAVVVAADRQLAFDYWHEGTGSLIFSAVAAALFGVISVSMLRRNHQAKEIPLEQ